MITQAKLNTSQSGFTLVEIIVSIVVFAVIMLSLAQIYATGTIHVVKQGDRRKATLLAQEQIEGLSTDSFANLVATTPTTMNSSTDYTNFSQSVNLAYVDDANFNTVSGPATNSIRIIVIISTTQGVVKGFQDITLQNVVTDW